MEKQNLFSEENKYASAKRKNKRRSKILMCLAAAVVFCTSYALILPAITMEKEICTLEHEHTADCRLAEDTENVAVILEDDSAYVSSLETTAITVIGKNGSQQTSAAGCGDTVLFGFTAQTVSYDDKQFDEGRIRLEFVLPLSPEQAVFDVAAMTWIDGGTAAAVQTTEQREIDGQTVECQILSCYGKLDSKNDGKPAVPSEFSESAVISVLKTEAGQQISLGITAAMEFNEWNGTCGIHNAVEPLTAQTASCVITESSTEQEAETETENNVDAYAETVSTDDVECVAEAAYGDNWKKLRDSGWFEEYAAYGTDTLKTKRTAVRAAQVGDTSASSVQVDNAGGTNSADGVSVSKTIKGTELENVFDITLEVKTPQKIEEVISEPDMAVVIVMDISNTMNSAFGNSTRYKAAIAAAEDFLDKFAANDSLGVRNVGYVAFNTDAHKIFDLQSCTNETQAGYLKNMMRTATGNIINNYEKNEKGSVVGHNRFTNIEAGLKMASDMLDDADVSNKNKYIIFLSDGFPTTYMKEGSEYKGYDPYDTTDNRFYDYELNVPCSSGTSYSETAAIRAREMAANIKNSGKTIFSIGIDVEGQKIKQYIDQSEDLAKGEAKISVVDRPAGIVIYEIGGVDDKDAYKYWLKNKIGSGYYYDSTNTAGLKEAYNQIFEKIKSETALAGQVKWVATDPMPIKEKVNTVEFIGLYDKDGNFVSNKEGLVGKHKENAENTASYTENEANKTQEISWDLRNSGYKIQENSNGEEVYTYNLRYRVRLINEQEAFEEGTIYDTNNPTTLSYQTVEYKDGEKIPSADKTIDFPIPSVHGYLGELKFQKVGRVAEGTPVPLSGAVFTLSHDQQCNKCRGDGTPVAVSEMTAKSDENGIVSFEKIPSGHTYVLTETDVPTGYVSDGYAYTVTVAYDKTTVTVKKSDGYEEIWKTPNGENGIYGTIENRTYYELPSTGGSGTMWYTTGGAVLMISAAAILLYRYRKRRKEDPESS